MAVNKVVFGAVSVIDISDATVTPDKLAEGATAYDAAGEKIEGTAGVVFTDDGNGNVTVDFGGAATLADDGNGNVTVE